MLFRSRSVRVLDSFKSSFGVKYCEALTAKKTSVFRNVILCANPKQVCVDPLRFLDAIVRSMKNRLCDRNSDDIAGKQFIDDVSILNSSSWPDDPSIRHGEAEIRRLCDRFELPSQQALSGMRDFVEEVKGDNEKRPQELKPLNRCLQTFPVSTADCERGFSLMNCIVTDLRNSLTIPNVSNLMFVNINGPPIEQWTAKPYVTQWLKRHRSSTDTQSRKVATKRHDSNDSQRQLWKIL